MYLTTISELNYEIMLKLDYDATLIFCQVNHTIADICKNPQFWHQKIPYDSHYTEIKHETKESINALKDKRVYGMHIEKFPSIEFILPKRLLDLIEMHHLIFDTQKQYTDKMITIVYYDGWYVKYSANDDKDYNVFVEYEVNLKEVEYVLMNVYYYIFNNIDIEINYTD